METKREDRILIATFCGISPNNWLPNYDSDWSDLMDAISKIESITGEKFTIPRQRGKGYSIEKTYNKVLHKIKLITKTK